MSDITVTSNLFSAGERIPASAAHSMAGGDNVSPDMSWTGVPDGTRSLAVTCYDPDAPTTVGFSHWLLFDLDPSTTSLEAGAGAKGRNPKGSVLGFTDWGESQYGGMAPPPDDPPHHYIFTVWALDVPSLEVDETTTYAKFNFLTRGHVLAKGTLTGLFGSGG
jgi:Raf kinase inhibitor-like YbhB/YbcL family protein